MIQRNFKAGMWIIIGCSIFLLTGCGEVNPKDTTDRRTVDEARDVAVRFIEEARLVSGVWDDKWNNEIPSLGEGVPLFDSRDDVPDQFLFLPTCSDGLSCGNIVVRVSSDVPAISEFSEREGPPLLPMPEAKLYAMSPFHWYLVPNSATSSTPIKVSGDGPGKTYDEFIKLLALWRTDYSLLDKIWGHITIQLQFMKSSMVQTLEWKWKNLY